MRKFLRVTKRGFKGAENAAKKFSRTLDKVKGGLKKVVAGALIGFSLLGVAMADTIDTGADFGRAIGSAAAKFPEDIKRGTAAFKDLQDTARQVGKTTEFTSVQAAQGLNFLAKAGFKASFAMKVLPDIVDFATASEIEFAEAADIASDALGAFGLDSDNLGKKMIGMKRVMDVMGLTANRSNVSVQELFESVKDGAPIATAAGVSIETFAATMGFLANNGIKATKAGTAAKNITLALAGVGNQADKVFRKLGISLADENGQLRDQFDVLDDLRKKLAGFGQKQRVTLIESIFGKIPIAAATKLLDGSGKKVRALREELEKAGGSNKRIAEFIRADVRGSLDSMKSAIEGVKISIFTMNSGPLKKTIDSMTDWIRTNEELIATNITGFIQKIVVNFKDIVKWTKRIGIGIGVFIALSIILKTFIAIMTAVNIVLAANPIGLIVIAIAALIAILVLVIMHWETVKKIFRDMNPIVLLLLGPLALLIKAIQLIDDNLPALTQAWEKFKDVMVSVWNVLKEVFTIAKMLVSGPVQALKAIGRIGSLLGLGNSEEDVAASEGTQTVTPQEQISRTIEERSQKSTAELTIKDQTGKAELTGSTGPGVELELLPSGAF